jgi:hypothetical protein
MSQTVIITIAAAGTDTGPFNIYSNTDAYVTAFASGIAKASLLAGYTSSAVPDAATSVRVKSNNDTCTNYVDIPLVEPTTSTTTSTTSTPTTTTTTTAPLFSSYTLRIDFSSQPILCGVTPTTVFTYFGYTITTGTELFTTSSLLVPLIGYNYLVEETSGDIYAIGSGNGVIGMPTGFIC